MTVRAGTAYRKIWLLALSIKLWRWIGEWTDRVLHSILLHFASELKWSMKMRLLSVFYFYFEISITCILLSRPNWRIVSKLTTDVVTYCTEASNQKSKYAYRKIFFYKKALLFGLATWPRYRLLVKILLSISIKSNCWSFSCRESNSRSRGRSTARPRLRNDSGQVVHTQLPRRWHYSLVYRVVKLGTFTPFLTSFCICHRTLIIEIGMARTT